MKVWIVKFALTRGIYELEVSGGREGAVHGKDWQERYHGGEWWKTKENALVRAEVIRKNKIKSLRKQIEKLSKLKFA